MRTSLLAVVLLSGCIQPVDAGFELQGLGSDDAGWDAGGSILDGGLDAGVPCRGELNIATAQEWAAFASSRCVRFDGDLVIRGDTAADLTTVTDDVLQTVTGRLRIVGTPLLTTVTFRELSSADLLVDIALNQALQIAEFPRLATSSKLNLVFNSSLTEVNAPMLAELGGADIRMNDHLSALNFPALTSVHGELTISSNPQLRQCVPDAIAARLTTPPLTYSASGNGGVPNVCP